MRCFGRLVIVTSLALEALALPAAGQSYTDGPGLGLAIPDYTYDGTLGSMGCRTLPVPSGGGSGDFVSTLTLQIAMSHTYVGDLTIKLTSPGGTTITVLSRPGVAETADDGNPIAGFGENSNLVSASPLLYDDLATDEAEQMGKIPSDLGTDDVICQFAGSPCAYNPSRGAATGADTFAAAFANQTKVGNWQLCIGDSVNLDTGTLDGWTLNITSQATPVELQGFTAD